MVKLDDIKLIYKITENGHSGYFIEFKDGRKIHLTKKRTIIALLVLIKNGIGSESDIAQGNTTINEIRNILGNALEDNIIQDYYGDANKPYSELWNEEGFTFIDNLKGGRIDKSQKYTLKIEDHHKLFTVSKKANRKAPSTEQKAKIRTSQKNKCNFCGSKIMTTDKLTETTYAKDRRREVFDHRIPVEKGGNSSLENYQALCFYCNKCKWQICNICDIEGCDTNCALCTPEKSKLISPTNENISDVLASRNIFNKS
ncbi:MAG: HNH endonuclease signature motif containing protein [Flavobacterium sp.]|nr:HNH endonuclease signature motif containing protein [Flavobacterium sp.]